MTAFDFLLYAIAGCVHYCSMYFDWCFRGMSFVTHVKAELKKREINMKKMENNVWN
jgi:hypothetical protein